MENTYDRLTYYLARGLSCQAHLEASGVMHIEGVFEGSIKGEGVLIIGQYSEMKSDVEVDTVIIAGSFEGNITSRKKVSVLQSATVHGTVSTPLFDVEYGAYISAQITVKRIG